ncbi:MAG: alpha/beta hydrolase [Proteobacteria bacterium]|nr:alpha/beta hydrolase [Pseudomonadota bacterium]
MLKFIFVVVASYSLLIAVVYFLQDRMLYLPNVPGRTLTMTPIDAGMDYQDVSIESADGVTLHGWFIVGRSSQVLLFFHGNAGNISHRLDSIRQFRNLGLSVLIIDYRGYGQSGGRTTERGIYHDADAAWRYLTEDRGISAGDIVIFGRSLGASVASRLAARQQPLALIVESSFTSVPDIAQELYPWLPARWLSRLSHATRDYVRDVRCPVLVVHSRDDEIIPLHHGEAIFASAHEPKTLLALRGTHNDAFLRDERAYIEGIRTFLTGLSTPALPR